MKLKKHIAIIMAFVMLVSSLGATGYERYCGCSGEVYASLFFKGKSDCCNHNSKAVKKNVKSCCSVKKEKSAGTDNSCGLKSGKCCDTKVKYTHFDGDAAPAEYSSQTLSFFADLPKPDKSFRPFSIVVQSICLNDFLELCYSYKAMPPPLAQSGTDILRAIQIIRC